MAKCGGGLPSSTLALSMSCSPHERAEQWIEKEALVRLSKHKGRKDREREREGKVEEDPETWITLGCLSFPSWMPFHSIQVGRKGEHCAPDSFGGISNKFWRARPPTTTLRIRQSWIWNKIRVEKYFLLNRLLRGVLSGVLDSERERERERGSCKRKFRFGRMSCFMKIREVAWAERAFEGRIERKGFLLRLEGLWRKNCALRGHPSFLLEFTQSSIFVKWVLSSVL